MFDRSDMIEMDNAKEALAIGFTHAATLPGYRGPLYFKSEYEAKHFMSGTIEVRCIERLDEIVGDK